MNTVISSYEHQRIYQFFAVFSVLYQFYLSKSIINLMRNDAYLLINQYTNDLLKEKERLFINMPQTQASMFQNTQKKSVTQSGSFHPIPIQQKPLPQTIRSQDYAANQTSKPILSVQNPEKTKSSSLYQKNPKPKFEYLAYVQKQLKDEKDKKVNFSSILQSEHRLKDDLQQIKSKLESYYAQLQKKDELIVKKEKELFDSSKRYELAIERIDLLENKSKQLDHHNHDLYQQCMRYQQNQEYNSKLFDNYRILSEKCSQIEQILQQKDAYLESIITSKAKEYDNAINTKNHEIKALQERISILQSENALLVFNLKNQMTTPKPVPVQPPQDIGPSKFSAFRDEFESKINYYINENNRLKNIIGQYEGQLEQLKVQLVSLKNTIQAYEERDSIQKGSKLEEQINFMRDALDMEKMEKDQLISRHELEILKLENLLSEKGEANEGSLLNFCDKEKLRESLYLALEEVAKLNRKLLQKQERGGM